MGSNPCGGGGKQGTRPLNLNLGLDRNIVNRAIMVPSVHSSIGAHVSSNVRDKIASGQFVELESLLSTHNEEGQDKQIAMNALGELVVKSKFVKKSINDIESWTEAMLIFTSIYICCRIQKRRNIFSSTFAQ